MRITFLHPELDFTDGTARLIASVDASLAAGHEVSVVSKKASRTDALLETGASCFEGELLTRRFLGAFAAGRARQQVAELSPDLLHVTDASLGPLAARLSESLQRPYVLEVVRPFETSLRAAPAWLRAVLLPCSTFVESAVNRGGVPRSSLRVIEHGPDLAHDFAPRREIGDRRPVLMCFGTLDRDHGIDVLIECARLLKQARRELHTVVFGEGPDEGLLRRLARELELSDVLTITSPMLTDVNSALAQADLHVSCARRGNPGWSALQALGLGIPSIFSGLNSTFPLIEDRVDGLLVERNDPRKLVEGITTLLDNPRAAKLMGAKARAKMLAQGRAEQFRRELAELHAEALESTAARVPLGHEGALEA